MADVSPIKFYGRSKRNAVVPIDTRRPDWLRVRLPGGSNYSELKGIMRGLDLHTVCEAALATVMRARPDILNHNIETVPSLYPQVRPKGRYPRSLELLQRAKRMDATVFVKSGIMLGLGEELDEVIQVFRDLRAHDVEILTVGQYLRPTANHLPIARYVTPEEFAALKVEALKLGFRHVESGPLVRSSYHAASQVPARAAAG